MYTPDVFLRSSRQHRLMELQLVRHHLKNIGFLGGGEPGDPCIMELTGYVARATPPIATFMGIFPVRNDVPVWKPSSTDLITHEWFDVRIDADGRPSQGTVVVVANVHATFTGTVRHLGGQWSIGWSADFAARASAAAT